MDIRPASPGDLEAILQLDPLAEEDPARAQFIRRSLLAAYCPVALSRGRIVAYGVLDYTFFDRPYISMLYVEPGLRGRGIGSALMAAMEASCKRRKVFTSTNESNTPMQALLARLGYERSGIVENLDEGDPELIYVKKLTKGAG